MGRNIGDRNKTEREHKQDAEISRLKAEKVRLKEEIKARKQK